MIATTKAQKAKRRLDRWSIGTVASLFLIGTLRADPLDETHGRTFYIAPIGAYDLSPGSSNSIFLLRDRLLSLVGGLQPANIKVGFSMTANFISSTHGGYYDYIYTPAYAPWETDVNIAIARASDLPFGIHVNGTPWADPSNQSVDVLSNFLEKHGGGSLLQVDRLGRFRSASRPQEPAANEVFDGFADMLEMQLTLSRNATLVQDYLGRNARLTMRLLGWYREQHPDLLVFTSTSSEYGQNGAANSEYCDYGEWSKQEFRDWLSGSGLYVGQGQYASLSALNNDANVNGATGAGFPFVSWAAVMPPSTVSWSTLNDTGRWWIRWNDFRINQVRAMVQQQINWGFEAGWSPDFLFGHQIPFNPATTTESERRYASPWTSAFVNHGGNGITTYGSRASSTTIFNPVYANDHNWGIFEWNPLDASVANNLAALNVVWNSKAHILCPYAWFGQPTYQIYDRSLETAIAQFVFNRFNEAFTGLSNWETTPAARDVIWNMSRTSNVEAVTGISTLAFTNGIASGWITNATPWLTLEFNASPTRHIVSDGYHALSFRLNVEAAAAGLGRIEWQDMSGVVSSLPFVAKAGWNVYRLNLGQHAEWRERRIQRVRFQPCSAPGVGFALDWIRLEATHCWHFDDANELYSANQMTNLTVSAGQVSAVSGPDGYFYLATDKRSPAEDADRGVIDADFHKVARVRMSTSAEGVAELFWWKRGSAFFRTEFPVQAGTHTYTVDLSALPDWSGIVTRLRFDPVNNAGASVTVDYLSLSPHLLPPRIANSDVIVNSSQSVFLWDTPLEPSYPAVTCDMEVATDFFFTNVVHVTNGLTGGRHVYAGVPRDGLHWWRIRARGSAGAISPWAVPMPMFLRSWQMDLPGDIANTNQIGTVTLADGVWQGTSTGNDPYIVFNSGGNIDRGINADVYKRFRFRVKVGSSGAGNVAQVFYFPKAGGFVSSNFSLPADGQWHDVELEFTNDPQWKGYVQSVRLDPTTFAGVSIAVDSAELLPGPESVVPGALWQFDTNGNFEGWQPSANSFATVTNGAYVATLAGGGAFLEIAPLRIRGAASLDVRLRNQTAGTTARLYWGTESSSTLDPARSATFPVHPNDSGFTTYHLHLGTNAGWADQVITWLRLVPAEGVVSGSVEIDQIILSAGVNQPPTFTISASQTVLEDSGPRTVPNWATGISPGSPGEIWQAVSFVCSNSNPALFAAPPTVSSVGTLTFTPATNANGSVTATVWAQDDGGTTAGGQDTSSPQNFTITITPVNDPPTFVKGADINVNQDTGPQSFPGWATNLDRGAPDEAGQGVSFTVTNNNSGLFSAQPSVNSSGALTLTPALNAVGTAAVGIRMFDSGGTANGGQNASTWQTFTILIQPVNQPPVALSDSVATHANVTTSLTVSNLMANDSDPENDLLSITEVTAGTNASAVSLVPGAVLFTPASDFAGPAAFTYVLSDSRGGQATGSVSVAVIQPRITDWLVLSNGAVRLTFTGIPGTTYQFQASTNLQSWLLISTNTTDASGQLQAQDLAGSAQGRKFFRFQWP